MIPKGKYDLSSIPNKEFARQKLEPYVNWASIYYYYFFLFFIYVLIFTLMAKLEDQISITQN